MLGLYDVPRDAFKDVGTMWNKLYKPLLVSLATVSNIAKIAVIWGGGHFKVLPEVIFYYLTSCRFKKPMC